MRRYHSDTGRNCLACCLAGLFDLPLDIIPTVEDWAKAGPWFDGFYDYCTKQLDHIPVVVTDDTLDGLFNIEVFEAKEGVSHAIICRGDVVIHNPSSLHPAEDDRHTEYRLLLMPIKTATQRHTVLEGGYNDG